MGSVGIFWDYENCAPPAGMPGYTVAERVRAVCSSHGSITQFRAYLELSASHSSSTTSSPAVNTSPTLDPSLYPSTSSKTLNLRSELQSSGVSLIDCPHDNRKNVADTMLACDLVCFALDHRPVIDAHHLGFTHSSPYNISGAPFPDGPVPFMAPLKTTVVLISGDRDFAYPLAVLKSRKYEIGLVVPPGGAHPALRAQASWVLNWKDVMEGTEAGAELKEEIATVIANTTKELSGSNRPTRSSSQATEPRAASRRPSFSRQASAPGSNTSLSSPAPIPPLPPPPVPARPGVFGDTAPSRVPSTAPSSSTSRPPNPPSLPEELRAQPPSAPKISRRSSNRRAAKASSRPPSRSRSTVATRTRSDNRAEEGIAGPSRVDREKPQPTIIPVPLTASPIGSAGPSFAAISPQQGRPHTPPLFSTHPISPSPPAAPPALASHSTHLVKADASPAKPLTPPHDGTQVFHRPPVPHVPTPRPPVSASTEPIISSKSKGSLPLQDPAVTGSSALHSLIPIAPALHPRPPLTALAPVGPVAGSSALTPATPVTPPASPPFRPWAKLQPVNDETDADGNSAAASARSIRDKGKGGLDATTQEQVNDQQHSRPIQVTTEDDLSVKKSAKLAVDEETVGKMSDRSGAISRMDDILKSYSERTPTTGRQSRLRYFDQAASPPNPVQPTRAPTLELGSEDEEKFDESYFASLVRPARASNPNCTGPATVLLHTLGTLETMPLELILTGSMNNPGDFARQSDPNTPRPLLRTHSLPAGAPITQSLRAGPNNPRNKVKRNPVDPHLELLESIGRDQPVEQWSSQLEGIGSVASSPPIPSCALDATPPANPPLPVLSPEDSSSDRLVDSTFQEFRVLINVLERLRREGNERPLRSRIGTEFSRDVFLDAGVSSFREYVNRAGTAGVVNIGGGDVQGREWISLNQRWQGVTLGPGRANAEIPQ